jgi:hypothetical protein
METEALKKEIKSLRDQRLSRNASAFFGIFLFGDGLNTIIGVSFDPSTIGG